MHHQHQKYWIERRCMILCSSSRSNELKEGVWPLSSSASEVLNWKKVKILCSSSRSNELKEGVRFVHHQHLKYWIERRCMILGSSSRSNAFKKVQYLVKPRKKYWIWGRWRSCKSNESKEDVISCAAAVKLMNLKQMWYLVCNILRRNEFKNLWHLVQQ